MRNNNSNASALTRSTSGSTTHHHPQLLTQDHIADGYDFNRARSSESTENALAGKPPLAVSRPQPPPSGFASTTTASHSASSSAEDRGVPISPKKLPPTPPRDHGSPYRPSVPPQDSTQAAFGVVAQGLLQPQEEQPFFPGGPLPQEQLQHQQLFQPFLRPSPWRQKEEDLDRASVFRESPILQRNSMLPSREQEGFYTIQRTLAFDEGDSDLDYE
jgi:hypothetical protein